MHLKITNGRIIDPANDIDQISDLFIEHEYIAGIGAPPKHFRSEQTIDASGKIVCPGFVDLSAQISQGDIVVEKKAVASSGVTAICCPPDTKPVIDTPAMAELIIQNFATGQPINIHPLGALTQGLAGETLSEMDTLKSAGCVGMSNAYQPISNTEVLRRSLEYAKTCDTTVHLFCEDPYLANHGVAHEGAISMRLGLPSIPAVAESIAVNRALLLVELTGAKVHFCRLSSASSIQLVTEAKQKKLPISADVSIAHLHLTEFDIAMFDANCHVRPPFRTERDRDALRNGLFDGTIDAICSDHQPLDNNEKLAPFSATKSGASTLEMLLPLTLELTRKHSFTISQAIAALSFRPAKIAGLEAGTLSAGSKADICLFDPEQAWVVDREKLLSNGKNTPFATWEMIGKVTMTMLAGNIIYRNN